MSALTDLFTSFANKIRSKVGGVQTYTPLEMVSAIDDVYDAGAASVPQPTNITPSNASPVALAANSAYKPTAAGYAIESYTSKTPSDSTPPSVASGEIVKTGGAGYMYASNGLKDVKTGTLTASEASTEYTINTGLTSISNFMLHGVSNKSYGTGMQFFNRWESSDASNQYILTRYASNGTTAKQALSSSAITTAITIESVSGGTVKIKSASNVNWIDVALTWWAW